MSRGRCPPATVSDWRSYVRIKRTLIPGCSRVKGQPSWGQLGFTGGVKGLTAESLLPPVAVLRCGFSLPVCGFGEDFHVLIDYR